MHVLRLMRIFIPLLLLAVIAAGIVLVVTSRSDLEKSRDRVEQTWAPLRDALNTRYNTLAVANTAVAPVPGPLHQIVTQVTAEHAHWRDLVAHNGSVAAEVDTANALESLGRRLVRAARAAPRLEGDTTTLGKVDAYATLEPPSNAKSFDDAVARFERKRNRPAHQLAARILGYKSIAAYEASESG